MDLKCLFDTKDAIKIFTLLNLNAVLNLSTVFPELYLGLKGMIQGTQELSISTNFRGFSNWLSNMEVAQGLGLMQLMRHSSRTQRPSQKAPWRVHLYVQLMQLSMGDWCQLSQGGAHAPPSSLSQGAGGGPHSQLH